MSHIASTIIRALLSSMGAVVYVTQHDGPINHTDALVLIVGCCLITAWFAWGDGAERC